MFLSWRGDFSLCVCLADDIFMRNIKKGSEALRSYINSEVVKELNKLMPSHIDLTGEDHVDLTDDGETGPSYIDLTEETSSSEHLPNEKQLTPVMEVMNPATEVNKENAVSCPEARKHNTSAWFLI